MKIKTDNPPPLDVYDVSSWRELPDTCEPAKYRICNEGRRNKITSVAKKQRQVLEALMQKPVVAASRCRISDCVSQLKKKHGLQIDTLMNDFNDGCFGIYVLKSNVECLSKNRRTT